MQFKYMFSIEEKMPGRRLINAHMPLQDTKMSEITLGRRYLYKIS